MSLGLDDVYRIAELAHVGINEEAAQRMQAELKYNKMDVFRYCKIGYLVLGGLLLVLSFAMLFRRTRWMKVAVWLLGAGVLVVFHYHMFGMGMRWYIGGYAPWSNSYETMVYVGWATVLAGLLFVRRSTITFALATLFGGIILFVRLFRYQLPDRADQYGDDVRRRKEEQRDIESPYHRTEYCG